MQQLGMNLLRTKVKKARQFRGFGILTAYSESSDERVDLPSKSGESWRVLGFDIMTALQ